MPEFVVSPGPRVSPEEIMLAHNAQLMNTLNQYGPAAVARAKYETGAQQALLAQRLAGEQEIAKWHEKAANIRTDAQEKIWDKRIQGQVAAASAAEKARIEKMNAFEQAKEKNKYLSGFVDPGTKLYYPPIAQAQGESDQDYLNRAATTRAKEINTNQLTAEKNTYLIQGRMNQLVQQEEARKANYADASGRAAVNMQFPPKVLAQVNADIQAKMKAGASYRDALAAVEAKNPQLVGAANIYDQKSTEALQLANSRPNPVLQTQLHGFQTVLNNPASLAHEKLMDEIGDLTKAPQAPATPSVNIRAMAPGAGGAVAPQASRNQFLPDVLQNPNGAAIAQKYHPMGANFGQDTGDIIGNTMSGIRQKIQAGQDQLKQLGVAFGANGQINVPTSQSVTPPVAPGSYFPMPRTEVLSPQARQQIYNQATQIAAGIQQAQQDADVISGKAPIPEADNSADYGGEMGTPAALAPTAQVTTAPNQ